MAAALCWGLLFMSGLFGGAGEMVGSDVLCKKGVLICLDSFPLDSVLSLEWPEQW